MDRDPLLAEMDDETLVATATMTASCLDADVEIGHEALAGLIRELVSRLAAVRAALVLLGRVHMPAERHWGYFESDGALPVDLSPAVREVFDDLKATVLGLEAPDA